MAGSCPFFVCSFLPEEPKAKLRRGPYLPTYKALCELGRLQPTHQRPRTQRDATREMHLANKKRISQEAPNASKVARVLALNSLKGSGGWIDTASQWMPRHAYTAARRLRCLATALSLPAGAQCPGCPNKYFSQVDFALHTHGCTRCPTKSNATKAHDYLTGYIEKHATNNAVAAEAEPRGYQGFKCHSDEVKYPTP